MKYLLTFFLFAWIVCLSPAIHAIQTNSNPQADEKECVCGIDEDGECIPCPEE